MTPAQAETVQWASSAEASSAYGTSPTPESIAQHMVNHVTGPANGATGPAFSLVNLLGPAVFPAGEVVLCSVFAVEPCVPEDPAAIAADTAAGAETVAGNAPGFAEDLPDTLLGLVLGLPDAILNMLLSAEAELAEAQAPRAWSKEQALGEPDTYPGCGDIATAWAPQPNGPAPEFLTLRYDPPVANATRIDIYETNVGGFVTSVVITLADGSTSTVFEGDDTTPCPGILSVALEGGPTVAAVTVNTQAPGWEEIDAVGVIS